MKLEPFNFFNKVSKLSIYQHICYYYSEAKNGLRIMNGDKKSAMPKLKELVCYLKKECHEYDKVTNSDYIISNGLYSQYVSNIKEACSYCDNINSYDFLSINLYNICDYMKYGLEKIFNMSDIDNYYENNINDYIHKVCCIELKNGSIYIGKIDIKIHDGIEDNDESVSVFFLENWRQIMIENIDKIKIMDEFL